MQNINEINKELKQIDERLLLTYDTEDLDRQDMQEYGIDDIEDTRTYSLLLDDENNMSFTVMKTYFDLKDKKSCQFGDYDKHNMKTKGFTIVQIAKIEKLFSRVS